MRIQFLECMSLVSLVSAALYSWVGVCGKEMGGPDLDTNSFDH